MSANTETVAIEKTGSSIEQNISQTPFKLYKVRWFMLLLFTVCYACTAFHFLQFSIIANIVVEFYEVSYEAVDWSAMVPLVLYAPCLLPVMHIINKFGIRASLSITMLVMCAASWIKVGTADPGRYWLVMLAQVLVASFQVFITVLPAQIASTWFGVKETALACGIGVFGFQLGIMLGCYIPTIMINNSNDKSAIANDMNVLNTGFAVVTTVITVLTIIFFKSEPPCPPSGSQGQLQSFGQLQFKHATKQLFTNSSYVLLLTAYAISIGTFYVIPTLLNQIVLQYYPNSLQEVGTISLILNIMGMIASAVSGYILGKLQRYRGTTISIFALYLLGMVLFTVAPFHSLAAVYIATIVLGFSMTATYSICLEIAGELTYPVPETTSSGYLIASSQLVAIGLTYLYSFILHNYSAFWANIITCAQLLISNILIICMKFNRKRQAAEESYNKRAQIE